MTVRSAAEQLAALRHAAAPYPALAKKLTGVVLSNAHRACTQLEQFARAASKEPGGAVGAVLAAGARRIEAVLGSC